MSSRVFRTAFTPYFPKSIKPSRIGVYSTSMEHIKHLGGAYGYWNGRSWERYNNWGDYSKADNLVWRGLVSKSNHQDDVV